MDSLFELLIMASGCVLEKKPMKALDELQEITGESREELVARAEQMKNELRAAGKNPDEYIKEIPSAGHNILYFPNGLTS